MLTLKLLLVPCLIGLITFAAHRWGPAVAGWLSGFPVVAGPVLLFLAIERGPAFAAQAATATLSAMAANLLFGLSYAWAATRWSWLPCLLAALLVYGSSVLALNALAPSILIATLMSSSGLLLAARAFPRVEALAGSTPSPGLSVLLRMSVGTLLVLLLTRFAQDLGPQLSGLLAMFPVMASVLAVFSQRQSGAAFAIKLLRGMVYGYYAFGAFCLGVAVTLSLLGIARGFSIALVCAVLVQAGSRILLVRAKRTPPETAVGIDTR